MYNNGISPESAQLDKLVTWTEVSLQGSFGGFGWRARPVRVCVCVFLGNRRKTKAYKNDGYLLKAAKLHLLALGPITLASGVMDLSRVHTTAAELGSS